MKVNAIMLHSEIGLFQAACLLGYSTLPQILAASGSMILSHCYSLKLVLVIVGFFWALVSTIPFMHDVVGEEKAMVSRMRTKNERLPLAGPKALLTAWWPLPFFHMAIAAVILLDNVMGPAMRVKLVK
eukprot:gnl/TRDRNA2_/TRDRNA2_169654_c1_seq1.p3 gnl/TRDRNA2_/TRDRNA2_169654_c1~~gnl/TRDRNA2_/TRDRNA2_169654_c1_seq1.p3  ORF type:complete len:128 (-),score=14.29 gnl/TRDRNA2_/TRDRNA2_169654_c1_seq1:370-753(-)